jgi:hypothetical protein
VNYRTVKFNETMDKFNVNLLVIKT